MIEKREKHETQDRKDDENNSQHREHVHDLLEIVSRDWILSSHVLLAANQTVDLFSLFSNRENSDC